MMNKIENYSKETLEELMASLGSMGKVATTLSLPYGTVRTWFNKYGLYRPESCRHIFHELRNTPMSDVHKSVILGSILGDGGLQLPKHSKNVKLAIKHCLKQKGYLEWKKRLLDPFSRPIYKVTDPGIISICGKEVYNTGSFATYTMCHPDITTFFKDYYVSNKKKVNIKVIDTLDLLAVSIWIADDGSFYSHKKWNNIIGGHICTNSFTYEDQLILKKALSKFFSGNITILPTGSNGQFSIKLSGSKSLDKFLTDIRGVLPECIHYKLDPQRLYARPLIKGDDIV